MGTPDSTTTRLAEYIAQMLPWTPGHQRKARRNRVPAILDQQSGGPAQLARRFGNHEAAKRCAQVLHNERLEPRHWADAVLLPALGHRPTHGPSRWAIAGPIEGHPPLRVISLVVGRRAGPF